MAFLAPLVAKIRPISGPPSPCLLCASPLSQPGLCTGCQLDLPYLHNRNLCGQCSLETPTEADYCGHCLRHPPAFTRCLIPYAYDHPLAGLIHQFKYRRSFASGKLLGQLLAVHLKHWFQDHPDQLPDIIIPAPMHWMRRWQRGFNQAEVFARHIAKALELDLATDLIQRKQRTPAQKELTRAERQKNLRGAFRTKKSACLAGKRIALVDDVVTTTATVRELSKQLIKAGAKEVQVWALARTMDKF